MDSLAVANIRNPALNTTLQTMNGTTFISKLVPALILLGLTIGTLFFFFNLIIGGVMYINSGGDKAQVEAAKQKLSHALIGIVVLFGVFAILNLVSQFLGTNLLFLNLSVLRIF
jgi:hypothetical protein